jgi:hypothetical protein
MELRIINLTKLLAMAALLATGLNSCVEKQKGTEIVEKDTKGNIVADYDLKTKNNEVVADINPTEAEKEAFKNRFQNESFEIDNKLESLKSKIRKAGKKADEKTSNRIDSFERERKSFDLQSDEHYLEARWEKFRDKVNAAIDSLDKNI